MIWFVVHPHFCVVKPILLRNKSDYESSHSELLSKSGRSTLYVGRLHTLATEMFRVMKNLVCLYVSDLFDQRENIYDIRNKDNLESPYFKTVKYGKKLFCILWPKNLEQFIDGNWTKYYCQWC